MLRVLLATEGPSEDVIGDRLVRHLCPGATVERKKFTARGISVVLRECPVIARAGHFGRYDILVVHFDLNGTLAAENLGYPCKSERWMRVHESLHETLATLPASGRDHPVSVVLMAPSPSTESWVKWGLMGGDGRKWERQDRHKLKGELYGLPPRKLVEKSSTYVSQLLDRMQSSERTGWPCSLAAFTLALEAAGEV